MSICTIFNKSLRNDAAGDPSIDTRSLEDIIPVYDPSISGIWKPLVIFPSKNKAQYCDPLIQAGLDNVSAFDPCNCSDGQISSVGAGFYTDFKESNLDTAYCGDYETEWRLYDAGTGESSEDVLGGAGVFTANCASGACDVRFKVDDFIAKVPVLNQSYISGFYDFKHLQQFPACTNEGLGFERFIEYSDLTDIESQYANFCIDWKLKPTISEIPYDAVSSYHLNEYTHDKSFLKSEKVSRTCGNFILTEVSDEGYKTQYSMYDDMGTNVDLPATGDFTEPYGFNGTTHNNLFIAGKRLASHWKWNVASGILGWYRHYDIDRLDDQRPVHGVDLYISQGDVFWATTDGPEPDNKDYDFNSTSSSSFIKNCPSGLKVVDGNTFKGIIPNGSEAIYISNNIYPKFYQFYEKYLLLGYEHSRAFRLSAIMATSPLYDGYTVDLLHESSNVTYPNDLPNEFGQIDKLNTDMVVGTNYKSSQGLNYISNETNLVDTLFHKYGGYLWIPPQTNETISFKLDEATKSVYCDIDFDIVVDKTITERAGRKKHRKKPRSDCSLSVYPPYNISYDQTISAGSSSISTNIDSHYRYNADCSDGVYDNFRLGLYGNVALNGQNFANKFIYDGAYTLSGVYSRISKNSSSGPGCTDCGANTTFYLVPDAEAALCTPPRNTAEARDRDNETFCYDKLAFFLNNSEGPDAEPGERPERSIVDATEYDYRRYKALAFNPHIDMVAFHAQGGAYFNSSVFGENKSVIFDSTVNNNDPDSVKIKFQTRDVGIKIYSLYAEKLQSDDKNSLYCKRFPVDIDNICKCYGLNLSAYSDHPFSCSDGQSGPPGKTYSNVSFYIPNLSTTNSPKLKYHGGYSPEEVKELFGITVQAAGGTYLPEIKGRLDPENPYSCDQSKTVTFGNYVTSQYKIILDKFSTDHADIYASVQEGTDYTGQAWDYHIWSAYDYGDYTMNPNWKRFTNKVTVGPLTLYNNQRKLLFSEGSSIDPELNISLENPYLVALLGSSTNLKPPIDINYAGGGVTGIFGGSSQQGKGRGDELSTVSITFEQKPRKQLLTFKFNQQDSSNLINFQKTDFDPEYGLVNRFRSPTATTKSISDEGRINYARVLDRKAVENIAVVGDDVAQMNQFFGPINALKAPLTPYVKSLFNSISSFELHKKPRLYLNRGGCWYIAKFHNRGGFEIADNTYIGKPRFFEYTRSVNDFSYTACLLPGIPKKPITLNSIDASYVNSEQEEAIEGEVKDLRTISVPGASAYFRIPEEQEIIQTDKTTIQDYVSSLGPNESLNFKTLIQLKDHDGYFLYVGPEITDLDNYIFIGNDSEILKNNSNLDIDYDNASKDGLVYNTEVRTNSMVYLTRKNLIPTANVDIINNKIIKKRLVIKYYDTLGKQVSGDDESGDKTIRIFTEFDFINKIHQGYNFIGFSPASKRTLLWDQITTHTDNSILLDNDIYKTKWGDLIKYDGFLLNNPFIPDYKANNLPNTPYNNLLYKMIVNDGNSLHQFVDNTKSTEQNPYFYIRQKYSIGDLEDSWDRQVERYQNFVPVAEVNTEQLISATQAGRGHMYHSALFNVYTEEEWANQYQYEDLQFFITDIQDLETAYIPHPTSDFYTETFRISNPLFWLDKTIKNEPKDKGEGNIIEPGEVSTTTNTMSLSCFNTETIDRDSPFYSESILADMDDPEGCLPQAPVRFPNELFGFESQEPPATCVFRAVGSIELRSRFKIGKPRTLTYEQLPGSVQGFISYEGGLYNPLGDSRYTQIVRTELPADNPIDPELNCSTSTKIPEYEKNLTSVYQNYIDANAGQGNHSTVVKNMDLHANEMLFRILYGEKIPINKKQLFVDKNPLTKNELIGYVSPEIKAKDLYNEILYNYDKSATSDINSTGSYTINGLINIGDHITFTIGDVTVNLGIVSSEDSIIIEGNIGSESVSTTLYDATYNEKSLIVQRYLSQNNPAYGEGTEIEVPAAPEPASDKETIELVSTKDYVVEQHIVGDGPPGLSWYRLYPGCVGELCMQYPQDGIACAISNPGRVMRSVIDSPTPCHPGTKPGDPYTYGYCRVDDKALEKNCTDCDKWEATEPGAPGSINFEYTFEDCSKKFRVFGHSYRHRYTTTDTSQQITEFTDYEYFDPDFDGSEAESQAFSSSTTVDTNTRAATMDELKEKYKEEIAAMNDSCGEDGHTTYGCHPETSRGYEAVRGCGNYGISDGDVVTQKVYVRTTTYDVPEYAADKCPSHFFTVNFTNRTLTVVLPNNKTTRNSQYSTNEVYQSGDTKTYCVDLKINGCPNISATLPAGYTISENLNTSCDTDCTNDSTITVPTQSRNFSTRAQTAVCVLGMISYGNVQGPAGVGGVQTASRPSDGRDDFGRAMPPCYGNGGGMMSLCDGSGAIWEICNNGEILHEGLGHRNGWPNRFRPEPGTGAATVLCDPYTMGDGYRQIDGRFYVNYDNHFFGVTGHLQAQIWRNKIKRSFNRNLGTVTNWGWWGNDWAGGIDYGAADYQGSTHNCQVVTDIPEDEIFEGVVPGSCELKFYSVDETVGKVRQAGIGNTEFGTWTRTWVVAYIQYKYKTTDTVDSVQTSNDNEGDEVVFGEVANGQWPKSVYTNNAVDNCTFNSFPESWGYVDFQGINRGVTARTYINTTPTYSKTACDDGVGSYNNYDELQTICDYGDWQCWAANGRDAHFFLHKQRPNDNWR